MTDENDKPERPWVVRDVSEQVRQRVKVYAVSHNITIAEALAAIVELALGPEKEEPKRLSEGDYETIRKLFETTNRYMNWLESEGLVLGPDGRPVKKPE